MIAAECITHRPPHPNQSPISDSKHVTDKHKQKHLIMKEFVIDFQNNPKWEEGEVTKKEQEG